MELNPKIAGIGALIQADRDAERARTDASMKTAVDAVAAKTKSECDLLGIPYVEPKSDVKPDLDIAKVADAAPVVKVTPELKKMLTDIKADQDSELQVKPLFPI